MHVTILSFTLTFLESKTIRTSQFYQSCPPFTHFLLFLPLVVFLLMRKSVCLESWESSLWRTALLNSFQLNIVYGHFFFYWHGSVFTHDSSSSGVVNNPAYTLPFISIQSVSCHGDQRRQNTLYNVQPFFFLVCLPVSNILHFLFSWHYTRKEQEFNSKPAHAYFFEFCCFFFFCFNFSTLQ